MLPVSAEVPSAEVPPAEVPPAEVPSAEVPPAEVPPAEVPPAEVPQLVFSISGLLVRTMKILHLFLGKTIAFPLAISSFLRLPRCTRF